MPAELKRIASQVANAGRKPFEPGRARRYQQLLLYGGGFAVTLFILMCALLVTRLDVQDYRAQARLTFLYRKAQFSRTLEMADMVLATYGGRIEQLWNQGARPSADALAQFSAAGGVLGASNGDGSETLLALARLTPDRPAPSYARYLGALFGLVRQDDRSGHVLPPALVSGGEPLGGYLIGLDAPFLAVLGTELVPRAHARARHRPAHADRRADADRHRTAEDADAEPSVRVRSTPRSAVGPGRRASRAGSTMRPAGRSAGW
jgi:two-component system capsular synthesis sensor histidine kinase RcsC